MADLVDATGQPMNPTLQPPAELGKSGFVNLPPGEVKKQVPPMLPEVEKILWETICDEGGLLALCLEYCTDKVETLYNDYKAGRDFFVDDAGPGAPTRVNFIQAATPLSIKLYQEVLALMASPNGGAIRQRLEEAVKNAQNRPT